VTRLSGVLVPASSALTRAELSAISPFDSEGETPFEPDVLEVPYELGLLTRAAATEAAMSTMRQSHCAQIASQLGASPLNASCLYSDLSGRPLLLPVYIGAYRRGENYYRVVVNGQTAALTGKAPVSWWKILGAILGGIGCLGAIGLIVTVLGAIASQL
jgi:hypothetical protein